MVGLVGRRCEGAVEGGKPFGDAVAEGLVAWVGTVPEGGDGDGGVGEDGLGCCFEEGAGEEGAGGPAAEEVYLDFG